MKKLVAILTALLLLTAPMTALAHCSCPKAYKVCSATARKRPTTSTMARPTAPTTAATGTATTTQIITKAG